MSKETNQSNKKKKNTTTKNGEEKVTKSKTTKVTKKTEPKDEMKESKIRIIDSISELDEEYDEDLDFEEKSEEEATKDINFEEKEETTLKETNKKEKKTSNKDKKESKEKIETITKMAKEKQKKTKKASNNNALKTFLTIDKNRYIIYSFVAGVLLTTLIAFIIWPDRIAALKDGTEPIVKVGKNTYTADELYEDMKNYYSVSLLLDEIDNDLLTKLYPENEEMEEEVKSNAEYYFNMYEQYYGYTEEEFLEKNGFSSYNAFLEYLRLDYRRNKYLDDYIEDNLSENEIQKYYDENVFGDINTQHILVEVKSDSDDEDSEKLSDEDAKKLAEEIITKLNDGTSWESIQEEYKDKVTYEDLSYQSWDASLEESFMTALKEMEDNSYSEEPVKTSYGYHVIYRLEQKKQPSLKKSKDKIIENLITEKKSEDENLLYKALISLREEKKIDFKDTVMKSKYEEYCKQYK